MLLLKGNERTTFVLNAVFDITALELREKVKVDECEGAASHVTVLFVKYVAGDSQKGCHKIQGISRGRRGGRGVAAGCH